MALSRYFEDIFSEVFSSLSRKADHYVHRIKRNIFLTLLQYVFIGFGILCILIGLILWLRHYLAIEWILLILGVVGLYTGILMKAFRR